MIKKTKERYNLYYVIIKVSEQKIKQYCQTKGNMAYFETSAKDNLNVDKAFEEVARLAFKREAKDEELYN